METTRRMLQQEMSYMASRGPILRRFFGEENAPTLGTLTQEFERKGVRVCASSTCGNAHQLSNRSALRPPVDGQLVSIKRVQSDAGRAAQGRRK